MKSMAKSRPCRDPELNEDVNLLMEVSVQFSSQPALPPIEDLISAFSTLGWPVTDTTINTFCFL